MNIHNQSIKWRTGLLIVMLLLLTMVLNAQTTIEVSPEVSRVSPGSSVTINISIKNVTDLHLASIVVSFDNSVIQFENSAEGSFLKSNSAGYSVFYYEKLLPKVNPDTVRVDQAIMGGTSVDGSGDLYSLTFKALREGTSPIGITKVELRNGTNNLIQSTTAYSGTIVVGDNSNKSPQINSNPSEKGILGQSYTYSLAAHDPDGDTLNFRIVEAPPFLTVDKTTGQVSGVPDKTGKFKVVLRASDGKGGTATQTFWIAVFKTDHPPTAPVQLSPVNGAVARGRTDTLIWAKCTDPRQGDAIQYSVHIISAQIDTVFYSINDTRLILDSSILKASRMYSWTVNASDGIDTVRSDSIFIFSTASPTGIGEMFQAVPAPFMLESNYPNPLTTSTEIRYTVYSRVSLRVDVYNTSGSVIKTLIEGFADEGMHSVVWDGTDMYNRRLCSGMYIVAIYASGIRKCMNILLTR